VVIGVVVGVKASLQVGGEPDVDFIEIPGVERVNPVHRSRGKKITPVKPGFSVAGVGLSANWRKSDLRPPAGGYEPNGLGYQATDEGTAAGGFELPLATQGFGFGGMGFGVNQGPGFKPGCPAVVGGVVMGVKPAGKVGGGPDVDFIEIPGVECVNPVHRQGGKK